MSSSGGTPDVSVVEISPCSLYCKHYFIRNPFVLHNIYYLIILMDNGSSRLSFTFLSDSFREGKLTREMPSCLPS